MWHAALASYGIRTPRTLAAVGRANLIASAQQMTGPFITKHNRAGKGLGVRLFASVDALERHVDSEAFEDSIDGVTLIQGYIEAPELYITRVEFVGGKFLYAVRVDTTLGFELCPADVCQAGDAFCPAGDSTELKTPAASAAVAAAPRFRIVNEFEHPIIGRGWIERAGRLIQKQSGH